MCSLKLFPKWTLLGNLNLAKTEPSAHLKLPSPCQVASPHPKQLLFWLLSTTACFICLQLNVNGSKWYIHSCFWVLSLNILWVGILSILLLVTVIHSSSWWDWVLLDGCTSSFYCCFILGLLPFGSCYGPIHAPLPNSYIKALTFRTSKCDWYFEMGFLKR